MDDWKEGTVHLIVNGIDMASKPIKYAPSKKSKLGYVIMSLVSFPILEGMNGTGEFEVRDAEGVPVFIKPISSAFVFGDTVNLHPRWP